METNKITPRITPEDIQYLGPEDIFVFGSNLLGKHAGGAANLAYRKFGAVMGIGVGGVGKTFAIPTMGVYMEILELDTIQYYVDFFIKVAEKYNKKHFLVTKIGCGIAGYRVEDIAPLFAKAVRIRNIYLPKEFWDILTQE